ncbi:unnamed protein product [Symbiodinium natans]|uniref:Aconitase X catalytic domain-containing protein n=1 Tax=Symbiodinium natans TaxID=878477 RepID=A0A812GP50_9DINO|nr:unnamed protein product [Symbiodinium natans]
MAATDEIRGQPLVPGKASGQVLASSMGLSFWGGVSPKTGAVIDRHHPLHGENLHGKILALPGGRGSCTGSQVILELLLNGNGPAAIVLRDPDEIIALGAVVADEMFGIRLPVLSVGDAGFDRLLSETWHAHLAHLEAGSLFLGPDMTQHSQAVPAKPAKPTKPSVSEEEVALSADDRNMLRGLEGSARQVAMRVALRCIICRMAAVQGTKELISVSQSHIDGCTYIGPASLRFAQQLQSWGAQVRVPTTLNAISVDRFNWRALGVPEESGEPAEALANAYLDMGAQPSFTCAPYLLETAPRRGEHIGWGESNAVVFANSILGARTQKYADFLDACVAITGRAPRAGCHADVERQPQIILAAPDLDAGQVDDAFYPTFGYLCGLRSPHSVPAITGLEGLTPTRDDLKAFSAAFGTSSSAAMFHLVGLTPEAPDLSSASFGRELKVVQIGQDDLMAAWKDLDADEEGEIDLVALGNPHFSLEEHRRLAELCGGREKHPAVAVVVTSGPQVLAEARERGYSATLEAFGVQLVSDTCWCMLGEVVPAPTSVLPPSSRALMTNSAKYAHYAPGLVGRKVRFGSLAACVDAACRRTVSAAKPAWLLPITSVSSFGSMCHQSKIILLPGSTADRSMPRKIEKEIMLRSRIYQVPSDRIHWKWDTGILGQPSTAVYGGLKDERDVSTRRSEMMDGDGLTSRAVQQLAQRAEDPLLSERLRRIFCPPSRGNSVDSPPREDFASVGARGEDPCRVTKAVKVAPPTVADTDVATPPGTQASELRMGSKGSVTPSIRTAPATPAASPQVGGWVGHGHAAHTPATGVQGAAWVQRSYSGRATPVAPVSRHLSAGQSAVPVMPQFGRPSVVAVTAPLVAVASSAMPASHGTMAQAPTTQLPFSCQPMSSPNAAMQPRRHRFSAPAQATQVKRDPRLSQSSSVAPHAVQVPVQVPQPLPLPSGLTGPRAQFDL